MTPIGGTTLEESVKALQDVFADHDPAEKGEPMILIDAYKLCEFANNLKDKTVDANDIMRFPRVDAVEVVRCKDCVYSSYEPYKDQADVYVCDYSHWRRSEGGLFPDDFCSRAEKREDG